MSDVRGSLLQGWQTAVDYDNYVPGMTASKFYSVTDLLLERPNLNSSHLFRADILSDSCGKLQTVIEKGQRKGDTDTGTSEYRPKPDCSEGKSPVGGQAWPPSHIASRAEGANETDDIQPPWISGFIPTRKVVRRLIPRKPHLDRPMNQSCFVFDQDETTSKIETKTSVLVVYVPHAHDKDDIPWYHPQVRSLLYRYVEQDGGGTVSIHYQLFSDTGEGPSERLHRTMLSLLHTFVRLSKLDTPEIQPLPTQHQLPSERITTPAALKDTILPQHIVQNTYTRLKQTYASDLIARWTEKTDPVKHVFEDLSIAAFLIELWKIMYGGDKFPGFVDLACGNGVLVYILIREGFPGRGFDARKRRTWDILQIDECLEESLCIPEPFLQALGGAALNDHIKNMKVHNGIFPAGTFVISNHADELTLWTPILALMACPDNSLPFLTIPCCSHTLSGAKHRYYHKDIDIGISQEQENDEAVCDQQSATGDLKALRAQRQKAASHADDKSAYACLTKKTVALAEELRIDTEMTLMRIPSTRNIGIIGNRYRRATSQTTETSRLQQLLKRECHAAGGLEASAQIWIERATRLVQGQGRGKVNLGGSIAKSGSDVWPSVLHH